MVYGFWRYNAYADIRRCSLVRCMVSNETAVVKNASFLFRLLYLPYKVPHWFLLCDAMRCTVFGIVILSVRLSVRLSICHTRGLCPHGSTYDHGFFTTW